MYRKLKSEDILNTFELPLSVNKRTSYL